MLITIIIAIVAFLAIIIVCEFIHEVEVILVMPYVLVILHHHLIHHDLGIFFVLDL